MPRISIIIPVSDDVSLLEDTLVSVLTHRPVACEIFVAHAGNYCDPYDLAGEVEFLEVDRGAGVEAATREAMRQATGQVVHLLAPGCTVAEDWCQAPLDHFADESVAAVAPQLQLARRSVQGVAYRWGRRVEVAGKSARRSASIGPTAAAAFYRRTALAEVGGWPTTVGAGLADVDLALLLQAKGYVSVFEPESTVQATAASGRNSPFAHAM
ncbi:MAG: glycosyltransferase family 2 protein, partial [Planctomycetales bacterium]|nr:glycosyltransferase family 2 protein [Planctomycetales bacterium]